MSRLRNAGLIFAVLIASLLYTVDSAFARPSPDGPGPGPAVNAASPPVVAHLTSSGMAWWTVTLIAVASAAVAALATELWHVYRSHRRLAHRPATV
jgi:hypothetical protein